MSQLFLFIYLFCLALPREKIVVHCKYLAIATFKFPFFPFDCSNCTAEGEKAFLWPGWMTGAASDMLQSVENTKHAELL